MNDMAKPWPGYRYFRGGFIVIGLAMAFLYSRDALTTDAVRPNVFKGVAWILLALVAACASSGGMFRSYSVVQGIDQFLPVDVFTAGCPPRPEQIIEAVMTIQRMVEKHGARPSWERGKGLRLVAEPTYQVGVQAGQFPVGLFKLLGI